MPNRAPTALIAEDEPLLAQALQAALAQVWPALHVVATVGDGASAVQQALTLQPDVLFFDIRMPGMGGLEAAAELADQWPQATGIQDSTPPFPALVFVTAYDQYAVQAFEAQAVDYLLKPVQTARLQKTVQKLQLALAKPAQAAINFEATLGQLRTLLAHGAPAAPPHYLRVIQVSVGNAIHLVPVDELVYLEAADKYLRLLTKDHEYLLRTPIKDLLPQLDPQHFWQVHRGTVVRVAQIAAVQRDEAGRTKISLHDRPEPITVSRLYTHRFKAL